VTAGESELINDANEFVRQTSNLTSDLPQTTGVRPHPVIEVSESSVETSRFGLQIEDSSGEPTPQSE
jgi:hypothetical protein